MRQISRIVVRGMLVGAVDGDRSAQTLAMHGNGEHVGEIKIQNYAVVTERTTVFELLSKMRSKPVDLFLVGTGEDAFAVKEIKGVVSKERIADTMAESIGLFSE